MAEKTGNRPILHRTTVEIFIDRPNFGKRRMILPLQDVVTAPKVEPKKDAPEKDPPAPKADAEQPAKKPHYPVEPTTEDGKSDTFLGALRSQFATDDKKEVLKIRKVQLIGLVMHKEPVVYDTDKMPDMKEPKEVPTRALDEFEKKALEAIRGGDNLKAEKRTNKEIRMVGAIYAGQPLPGLSRSEGAATSRLFVPAGAAWPSKSRLKEKAMARTAHSVEACRV